jgi:hypothetical protein
VAGEVAGEVAQGWMFICLGKVRMKFWAAAINPRVLQASGQCPNMTFSNMTIHYKEAICETHDILPLCLLNAAAAAAAAAVAFLSSDIEILSYSWDCPNSVQTLSQP